MSAAAERGPVPPGRNSGRVLIVEDALRDHGGHMANLVRGMAAVFRERGAAVEVWGHRDVPPDLLGAGVALRGRLARAWTQEALGATRWRRGFGLLRHNLRLGWALVRGGAVTRPPDLVVAANANLYHLVAWRLWLALTPARCRLALYVLACPWLHGADGTGRARLRPTARVYRWWFASFAGAVRSGRCHLATETARDARLLRRLSGVAFGFVPVPRPAELLAGGAPREAGPERALRLGLIGRVAAEKGYDDVLAAIRRVPAPRAGGRRVHYVIQWYDDGSAPAGSWERLAALAAERPGEIEIVRGALPTAAYVDLVNSLDAVLLPYRAVDYAARGSSVASDAFCAGKPVVCPARTDLEARMHAWGAGVVFRDGSIDGLAAAIGALAENYESLARRAAERREAARQAHAWPNFFRVLAPGFGRPTEEAAPELPPRRLAAWRVLDDVVRGWRLRFGVGGMARMVRQRAAAAGAVLAWRGRTVVVRRGGREILFDRANLFLMLQLLPHLDRLGERTTVGAGCGRDAVDLRGVRRYRQWGTNEELWHPGPPELVDVAAGYFLHGQPPPGATVFDVGAYIGEVTIPLARRVGPAGRVFAFEPDRRARTFLERNVRDAGLGNVTIVPKGLWRSTGVAGFDGEIISAGVTETGVAGADGTVETLSFAEACRLAGRVPDFVKMDIEGAELEAIGGALDVIRDHAVDFAIASYHVRDGRPTSEALERLFASIGYAAVTGFPEHRTTYAWKQDDAAAGAAQITDAATASGAAAG